MSITMQGSWTIRVKSKDASFAQRFQIVGSDNADGTYTGDVMTAAIFVTGAQWSINIQHKPGAQPWRDSAQRITFPTVSGGLVKFDIRSNDSGADQDYDDLILTCSLPVSSSEYIIYGTAKTYSGLCFFNPCHPGYFVIDRPDILAKALLIPDLRRVIEKLYPERVPRRIPPPPDPPPYFKPIVIPTGAPSVTGGIRFRSDRSAAEPPQLEVKAAKGKKGAAPELSADQREEAAVAQLNGTAHAVTTKAAMIAAGEALLDKSDLLAVAGIFDRFTFGCNSTPAPGLLLRFQEYDRTASEKLGGAYTGTGVRENLGLAVTDEQGNYIFRFSRSLEEIADETEDVSAGETLSIALRPDLIVQALGTGLVVEYESAPYFNIPNLKRIDLCIPHDRVHPNRACVDDRVIQRIGDIIVLNSALSGHPNTLDADGRITSRNANAPRVDDAAWRGGLRLYACFGKPEVFSYSVRFRRIGIDSDWQFVSEEHRLNHIPDFSPTYTGTVVGSTLRSVHVDGGSAQNRPTYDSHEFDLNWIENDLKLILSSGAYRPFDQPGSVDFKIEAYDSSGNLVAGTQDTIRLYIDNRPATGDIASITMGTTTLGDCALFELTDPKAPLTVRYRVDDPEGFLQSWALSVTRGNNHPVPVDASGVTPKSYPPPTPPPPVFHGTRDEATADTDHYVTTTLTPSGGANWLPSDHNFCAFAFTLTANDRVTDGRSAYPRAVFWQDLIGISFTPPES